MTLWRFSSGGKLQRGENRIGGGGRDLPFDPVLNLRQTFRRLMDVVPVGDIGKSFEQLFEAFRTIRRCVGDHGPGAASWCAHHRQRSFFVLHLRAFPRNLPTWTQTRPAAA